MSEHAFDINGITINSQKYGKIALLQAVFNGSLENPNQSYTSVDKIIEANPFIPFEQTLFVAAGGNIQHYENFGFPTIFPYGYDSLLDNVNSYSDVWTFSNGEVYYVYRYVLGNVLCIGLSADPNLSASSLNSLIRFTTPVNVNNATAHTILNYNPTTGLLEGMSFTKYYTNQYFRISQNSAGSSTYPLVLPFTFTPTELEIDFYTNHLPIDITSTDPYADAGDSGPGGGEGTFDYTGNPPGGWDPSLVPDISATDTGFVTLFNPTIAELQSLSNYLWSSAFDLNTFKKIFNDPMELFIGLSIVPVYVPDGGRKQVGIGLIDTGVYMTLAGSQWVTVDCGTLNVPNFTGSYLDYDPYTRVEIYLPFIGVRTLKADEVSGKAVHVGYWVDLLSGACVAWIDINNVPMYQFMGQCATSIPMASGEWTSLINGIIGAVGAVASGAAAGGVGGAIAGGVAAASSVAVNDSKIQVERSGAITSAAGLVALQMPVLYISAPNLHKPANQNMFEGYPAYYTATLGDVSGYTTIESIRLQGIPATEPELEEIETLLKGGVIL